MTGSSLRLVRLAKRYGAATVLDGLNLEITPGSFLAVVGRSDSLGDREGGCGCLWWWEYDG